MIVALPNDEDALLLAPRDELAQEAPLLQTATAPAQTPQLRAGGSVPDAEDALREEGRGGEAPGEGAEDEGDVEEAAAERPRAPALLPALPAPARRQAPSRWSGGDGFKGRD